MSSTPPFPTTADKRLLAAIVFTDVAGFTRRVQVEESKTLKLLERDFVSMRAFCAMHSGRVIKTTGDGLLLFFTSAVQAVEWSLRTQRHFAEQAAELSAAEILRHRVGIHIGDVFLADGDVMGDGVNIAARVQAEAPAGGICISQDVYGVVKNKMKLDVIRLEPRQLKNVNEPMQMYNVLLEPPRHAAVAPRLPTLATASQPQAVAAWRKWALMGGALVALAVAAFLLFQAQRDHERELAGSEGMRAALKAAMQSGAGNAGSAAESAPVAPPPTDASPTVALPAATTTSARPPPAVVDFARWTASRSPGAPATEEEKRLLEAANDSVATLLKWTPVALQQYTKDNPLFVRPLRNAGFQTSTVYSDAKGKLCFAEGGAIRTRSWQDLPAPVQGAIVASLIRNSSKSPLPDIIRGGDAFAYVNRLPEMAEMLMRERR